MSELLVRSGRRYRRADKDEILSAALQYAIADAPRERLASPLDAVRIAQPYLAAREAEVFCCAWITTRCTFIAFDELFHGTIDRSMVFPREIIKKALERNAAGSILLHNHPSGECSPSETDVQITQKIKAAFELLDLRLLDHIVIAGNSSFSFAENGLL